MLEINPFNRISWPELFNVEQNELKQIQVHEQFIKKTSQEKLFFKDDKEGL